MSEAALTEEISATEDDSITLDSTPEVESTPAESATASDDKNEFVETDNDKVQKVINEKTARYYAEKRKAEALQAELDALKKAEPTATKPTLEDHDFDDEAYRKAEIEYEVSKRVDEAQQQAQQKAQDASKNDIMAAFQAKEAEFIANNPDYIQKISLLPGIPEETLTMIMQQENGVEIASYLANNLDVADEIANLSPAMAGMKLGPISASLTATPKTVKQSAAPAPIEPVKQGGSLAKDDEDGVVYS